jgi:hypothetical protein
VVKISDNQHHAEAALVFKRPTKASTATLAVRDVAAVPERMLPLVAAADVGADETLGPR